jgi:uncharacterized protein involved in outer membrane biogenesis
MKVLKVVLIVSAFLVVVITAGLYVFLKTFDVNKFLPQITGQVAQAIGRDLKIGRAELGFSLFNGIGLKASDIILADDPRFSGKPFLMIDWVEIGLNPGALILQRKIQLVRVVIMSPRIVIIRSKEGLVNAASMGPKPSGSSSVPAFPSQGSPAGALPALLVNDIKIVDARLTYVDEMLIPHLSLQVDRIDISIRNFSLTAPFDATVKAALFSEEQDVSADARVVLNVPDLSADIKQMNIRVDLAKFDGPRLENELPVLKPLGLKEWGGNFQFFASDVQVSAQGLKRFKGQAVLDKGFVLTGLFPVLLENIQVQADLDEKQINVKAYSATVSEGTVGGTAVVSDYLFLPAMSITFDAQGINPKKLAEAYKAPLTLSGVISAAGDFKLAGRYPEEIMSSLNGKMKGELKDGVLENVNIFAAGLGNIPMLPGILDSVMADLPLETQDEVKKGITRFETCKVQARIVNGLMELDLVDITTRDLGIQAKGTVKLLESLSIRADIRVEKELSLRLSDKAKELAYLNDQDGRIYLPMRLTGSVMKPVFMPDLEYLTQKLIVAAGGEGLQKALGGSPAAAEAVGAIFDLFRKK